jgi:heme/copper-type cytochrome/quinol oxidase subunit 2
MTTIITYSMLLLYNGLEVNNVELLIIKKRSILLFFIISLSILSASIWFILKSPEVPAINTNINNEVREIHLVTGEFKATTGNGKVIEAYRWDPGSIFLEKEEKVNLVIYGVNGSEHPFFIEGTDIKGTVKKGEETVIPLQFDKEGTYRLICLTHPDKNHSGPMIAYINVD